MTTHDAINAYPVGANANKALQRALATKRFAYCLDSSESATALTVVDPADGSLPLYLIQNNILFELDDTDSTTAHDGVTCLVTADPKRYKTLSVALPYSVLTSTTTAQPVSPTVGDSYRIPSGATGTDWAGQDGKIGIYTARGWVFVVAPVGWQLYHKDTDAYWHKADSGSWTLGFGTQALGAGTVLPSQMSGGGGKIRWYIENQTTNAPPGSPTANVEYIIGPSPTGAWASKAGQIARYENAAWVYYPPAVGWQAFDKSLSYNVQYTGTAWISAAGSVIGATAPTLTTGTGSTTVTSGGAVGFSGTVGPPLATTGRIDNVGKDYAAKSTANRLEIHYDATVTYTSDASGTGVGGGNLMAAVFRDSETASIDWCCIGIDSYLVAGGDVKHQFQYTFNVTIPDTDSHTYKVLFTSIADTGSTITSPAVLTRRRIQVREIAA